MSALSHTEAEQSQSSYTPVVFSQQESNREVSVVTSSYTTVFKNNFLSGNVCYQSQICHGPI